MHKPNFSGTWKFNPAKSVLQISAPDTSIFVVDHREPIFRLSRTHVVGQTSDTISLEFTTDGAEIVVQRANTRLRIRSYWDDDVLVFHTLIESGKDRATNLVRYKLDGSVSLIADEQYRSERTSYKNTWVLDKQAPS